MGEVRIDSVLGLNDYVQYFRTENVISSPGTIRVDAKYFQDRNSDIYRQIAGLDDNQNSIDNTLELVLAMQYTAAVKIRPVKAAEILPESRASDIKLAAVTYTKLQEIKFLDPQNRERIGRYELMIHTQKQRNNITQDEINAALRGLISATVDEEFNKVSFLLENTSIRKAHNAVLTRNPQTGQYILSYEGVNTNGETRMVTGNSLEALSHEMRNERNKAYFDATGIRAVEAQAALIPAVVYADWKARGLGDGMALIKETLTNFYLNPSQTTYENVLGMGARYRWLSTREDDLFASIASSSLAKAVNIVNDTFGAKLENDIARGNLAAMMRVPNDSRFNIFSTPYR